MDFDAIPEGDLTKKPFTSRISNLRKQQLNWLAMFMKYENKHNARITIEDVLDFAICMTYESKLQEFSKPQKPTIAKTLQEPIIAQETLDVASIVQYVEPQPLQTASNLIAMPNRKDFASQIVADFRAGKKVGNDLPKEETLQKASTIDEHHPIKKSVFGNGK